MMSLKPKEYLSEQEPIWCPGCGDFGVLHALTQAFAELSLRRENLAVISGIGCSSRMPGYVHSYGFHGIHGRALPIATGLKLARPDLTVVVTMGDGDAYSIGGNHLLHAARRNLDLTCLIMDNRIYGMTRGQLSSTTPLGAHTSTTPYGSIEPPLHPLVLALASGATFAARGFSWEAKRLAELIVRGLRHHGFAVIDILSPCVIYRPEDRTGLPNQLTWIEEGRATRDRFDAMREAAADEGRRLGIFYEEERPTYWDEWMRTCEAAKTRPGGVRGLDAIVATLPWSPALHGR
jgi:2-oxoglutarate ferredoxin oxidoreductase subunit beta